MTDKRTFNPVLDGFEPSGNLIVGEPLEVTPMTSGGIHLAPTSEQPYDALCVVLVGSGGRQNGVRVPVDAEPDDVVYVRAGAARDIELGGRKLKLVEAHHVVGRWRSERSS